MLINIGSRETKAEVETAVIDHSQNAEHVRDRRINTLIIDMILGWELCNMRRLKEFNRCCSLCVCLSLVGCSRTAYEPGNTGLSLGQASQNLR